MLQVMELEVWKFGSLEGFSFKAGGVQAWGPSELFFQKQSS
jgi:hypothetical protein